MAGGKATHLGTSKNGPSCRFDAASGPFSQVVAGVVCWSLPMSLSKRPASEVARSYGALGRGFTRCWPVTRPRARQRSSRGPGGRIPGTWRTTTRSRCQPRRSPLPVPAGAGHPRPVQAAEVVLHVGDHSRYALSVAGHARVTGPIVLLAFRAACGQHGAPASTLTDNGMVFTTRLSGGRGGRNASSTSCAASASPRRTGKPNHPRTQGKGPAGHLRRHLQHPAPAPVSPGPRDPGRRLRRPVQSQPRRPQRRHPRPRPHRPRRRLRAPHPPSQRKLHHIGIGRAHAGTRVLLLVQDLDIRVINAATGELIRELVLNPDKASDAP
jgi:hypothetical protein